MTKTILLFAMLLPLFGLAQTGKPKDIFHNPNQFAYVNGIRLDSIQAVYAQVDVSDDHIITASVSYGQNRTLAANALRSNNGELFSFDSIAAVLNLLDYNGWEPVPGMQFTAKTNNIIVIMKRKKGL